MGKQINLAVRPGEFSVKKKPQGHDSRENFSTDILQKHHDG